MVTSAAAKRGEVEEEPPSKSSVSGGVEDKPPSSIIAAANRKRLFASVSDKDWNDWRWHFRNRITTVEELSKFVALSPKAQAQIRLVITRYPFAVTPYYLTLINFNNPNDPVRKQAIPCFKEVTLSTVGMEDPLEEKRDSVVPGLVHRYPDRVLMVLTDICPMFCRHCTRKREWQNGGWVRPQVEVEAMLDYIRKNKQVRDVIVSGGDPLTLSTQRLEVVLSELRKIDHVEIIRIGSRYPVVLPQRIDEELCAMLSKYTPIWLNTHFNHPNEITPESAKACDRLVRSGVPVNNQTVLLHGVNDTLETQLKLCHSLLKIKVRPYYLFQCDEVQGTEHFRTPVETGIKIIEGMRGFTSGLAIPTYVVDLSHGGGKIPLQPNYVLDQSETELRVRNYEGRVFNYRNPKLEPAPVKVPVKVVARRNGNTNADQLAFPRLEPLLKGEKID